MLLATATTKMDSATAPPAPTTGSKRSADDTAGGDEQQDRPKRVKMETRECSICCTAVALNQFPKHPHPASMPHKRDACKKCWQAHVAGEVESKPWDAVACLQCPDPLRQWEIKARAHASVYEK